MFHRQGYPYPPRVMVECQLANPLIPSSEKRLALLGSLQLDLASLGRAPRDLWAILGASP
jgi:hypothetical protein